MVEPSEVIRKRVQAVRDMQPERFSEIDSNHPIFCNTGMRVEEIRKFCGGLQEGDPSLMRAAMSQLNLSARACHRILKLACTIGDLAGSEEDQSPRLAEALQYRPKLMLG